MHKMIDDGNEVVVLHTAKGTKVLHPLTKIRSDQDRQSVIRAVMTTSNEPESHLDLKKALEVV